MTYKEAIIKRQNLIRDILIMRTRLEDRITKLGGTIPNPWPWDEDGTLRNLQLLEIVEVLEKKYRWEKGKHAD
jgi:hypothetical protein